MSLEEKKISSEYKGLKDDVEDTSHFFYQKRVVITGEFEFFPTREEMAQLLYNAGAKNQSAVNKKTDYVVLGKNAGWKKMQTIDELKVTTLSEQEFIEIFKL